MRRYFKSQTPRRSESIVRAAATALPHGSDLSTSALAGTGMTVFEPRPHGNKAVICRRMLSLTYCIRKSLHTRDNRRRSSVFRHASYRPCMLFRAEAEHRGSAHRSRPLQCFLCRQRQFIHIPLCKAERFFTAKARPGIFELRAKSRPSDCNGCGYLAHTFEL
ncbi:hypothetical protein BV25DRAFT_1644519 [Artomyces pyxidatus]|uniref:Uncharacterized protein n=1 Tax=Artomyces pyxidatus TaxID=48021 RepID=A0ACB8SK57_9AGAM|nr:hypothetical protein BV25DRAFT_1644519 [Artomyces pyxidatus]